MVCRHQESAQALLCHCWSLLLRLHVPPRLQVCYAQLYIPVALFTAAAAVSLLKTVRSFAVP